METIKLKLFTLLLITVSQFSFAQPANDDPCSAIVLPVNASCVNTVGTNVGATNSAVTDPPSTCAYYTYAGGDVWYQLTVPASGNVIVTGSGPDLTDGDMAIYSGTCGSLTLIECDDESGSGYNPMISLFGQIPGSTLWIRYWEGGNNVFGDFSICATEPPSPGPCAGDITINSTTYSQTGLTTCGFGDDYSSADACGGNYLNGDDIVIEYIPTTSECVKIATSNTASWTGMFITNGCPDDPNSICLASQTESSGNPEISSFNVVAGNSYYITISTNPAPQCTGFDLTITACPTPPANDDCSGAYPVTVNPDQSCTSTTPGTVEGATASSQSDADCIGTPNNDVWFSFVATETEHSIALLNITGSNIDMFHSVYTGNCATTFLTGSCGDPDATIVSGLTVGNTYYIRVYQYHNSEENTSFDLCVGVVPPPPVNDDCEGAYMATVNAMGAGCTNTTAGTITSSTPSTQSTGACSGTENDDVWFSFVAVGETMSVNLLNVSGSVTGLYQSVWTGTCPSLSLFAGGCGNSNSQVLTGLTIGTTYYIRVYSYTSVAGQLASFDLCLQNLGACSSNGSNDYCSDPATITAGPGGFSGTTSSDFTPDLPGDLNAVFCGSIENNSWFQFTASNTTESFEVVAVSGCSGGVQAEVYEIGYSASGCCESFTSLSNCFNPGTTTLGTVTAPGLTIGHDYILMVDGQAGANCDYTISNWVTEILLPVEMLSFYGYTYENENLLKWTTASEINNDYFIIEKSANGVDYTKIGKITGSGNSSTKIDYEFSDYEITNALAYYRLTQVDYDGGFEKIGDVKITRELSNVIAYPNPSSGNLTFEFNQPNNSGYTIEFVDLQGKAVKEKVVTNNTNSAQSILFTELNKGLYLVRIIDNNGKIIEAIRVIKE